MGPQELGLVVGVIVCLVIGISLLKLIEYLIVLEGRLRNRIFTRQGPAFDKLLALPFWLPLAIMVLTINVVFAIIAVLAIDQLFRK